MAGHRKSHASGCYRLISASRGVDSQIQIVERGSLIVRFAPDRDRNADKPEGPRCASHRLTLLPLFDHIAGVGGTQRSSAFANQFERRASSKSYAQFQRRPNLPH